MSYSDATENEKRKVDPVVMWGFAAGYKACCGAKCPDEIYTEWLQDGT